MDDDDLLRELFEHATPAHIGAAMRAFSAPGVLVLGDHVVDATSGPPYNVKIFAFNSPPHYCTCPSWKYERGLDEDGNCKHIRYVQHLWLPTNGWYILQEDPRDRPKEDTS